MVPSSASGLSGIDVAAVSCSGQSFTHLVSEGERKGWLVDAAQDTTRAANACFDTAHDQPASQLARRTTWTGVITRKHRVHLL